ncbi:MAG: divalent metal cation transporter [Candidatus Berkelbacteria bacterium]|nr:divalent metal cation transporter [Candidatus Berkelbacteria bacterium]
MSNKKELNKIQKKVSITEDLQKRTEESVMERVVESPAKVLDETIEISKTVERAVIERGPVRKLENYWRMLGPGLTTGAADDDSSGIGTYSQTGAQYGFKFLWLAPFSFPLMAVVQEMCARIGLVTGRGLAGNIKRFFPRWVLILCTILLFIANTFNIGADLGAMSEALRLFWPQFGYFFLIVVIAAVILIMQIFMSYERYAKYLKWLALVLFSYVLSTLLIKGLDWHAILTASIKPTFSFTKDQILIVTGALGTTISPYLFFWQTSQEVEESIQSGEKSIQSRIDAVASDDITDMRIDIWSGMFLSNLAMFFIIAACGATLHAAGIINISSAAQAATALRPLAGDYSYLLFAVGIIGVGALGIPVLAGSSSYAFAESFGWKQGLHYKLRQAYAFYGIIIISLIIGVLMNLFGLNAMKALVYSAIMNGCVAPIVLILILILASSKKVMGQRANRWPAKILGGIATLLMLIAGVATIWALFH